MATIVSIHDAAKDYYLGKVSVPALRGVSLDVTSGDFLSIAGPSGSGKTTLLNLIGCVDTPTRGYVEVAGKNTSQLSERALTQLRLYTIGFIFQSFNLVSVLDVFRNVELPLLLQRNASSKERSVRVHELMERVGLKDYMKHRPSELSGGQRQRVAIARALVTRPQLVLADEPTANLDSATGQTILDLMRELNHADGTTFIFSTHDARVMKYANAIVRLADGKLADTNNAALGGPPATAQGSKTSHNGVTDAERAELETPDAKIVDMAVAEAKPAAAGLSSERADAVRSSDTGTKEAGKQ